jgi:hypothetical protein
MVNAGQKLPIGLERKRAVALSSLFSLNFRDREDWHADRIARREAASPGISCAIPSAPSPFS